MKKEMSALGTLCADAEKELKKRGVMDSDGAVLIALSGGADSVALLYVLKKLYRERIFACHVNHGIRGDEADRDERFCVELCQKLDVKLKTVHINVPAECEKSGEGLEECARRLRYAELEKTAEEFNCRYIATAHHADDNIETVILHLVRGCGLRGLTGIPYIRGNIVRPLLPFSKERIVSALESENISYVYDSTNSDLDMSRNLIRHTVLPQLYKLNPSADTAFRRMCESVGSDEAFIENAVKNVPNNADREMLAQLHDAVLSRYIRSKYDNFANGQISSDAISDICRAVRKKDESYDFMLPDKVTAHVDRNGVTFVRDVDEIVYNQRLNLGENIISSCGYRIFITTDKNVAIKWKNIYKLSTWASVISDRILQDGVLKLFARSPMACDRYVFGKRDRSVQRQLKNRCIPEYRRKNLPRIVTEDGDIVFVPWLSPCDSMRAGETDNALYIVFADENAVG